MRGGTRWGFGYGNGMIYQVAVIGSGAAGMMAALSAAQLGSVVILTDRTLGKSNSAMAQGGLQCPFPSAESEASFVADIQRSARVPLNDGLLRAFAREVRPTVQALESLGLILDKNESGEWSRRTAGGLSEPRVIGTSDRIGPVLIKSLRDAILRAGLQIMERSKVTDLSLHAGVWRLTTATASVVEARAIVVATGGSAYAHAKELGGWTTNPANENESLPAILRRVGLEEVHADYFQYQPFGMLLGAKDGFGKAFPERILGFPIQILDRYGQVILDRGERPDRLELCERMIQREKAGAAIEDGMGNQGFHLILDQVPPSTLEAEFPAALAHIKKHGGLGSPLLIRPYLHYHLGGFKMDVDCQSSLPGLFLAGEVTGGLHGRNRLMGNGLTDSIVHGRRAGRNAALFAKSTGMPHVGAQ